MAKKIALWKQNGHNRAVEAEEENMTPDERKYYENFDEIAALREQVYTKLDWWPSNLFLPERTKARMRRNRPNRPKPSRQRHQSRELTSHGHHQGKHQSTDQLSTSSTNGDQPQHVPIGHSNGQRPRRAAETASSDQVPDCGPNLTAEARATEHRQMTTSHPSGSQDGAFAERRQLSNGHSSGSQAWIGAKRRLLTNGHSSELQGGAQSRLHDNSHLPPSYMANSNQNVNPDRNYGTVSYGDTRVSRPVATVSAMQVGENDQQQNQPSNGHSESDLSNWEELVDVLTNDDEGNRTTVRMDQPGPPPQAVHAGHGQAPYQGGALNPELHPTPGTLDISNGNSLTSYSYNSSSVNSHSHNNSSFNNHSYNDGVVNNYSNDANGAVANEESHSNQNEDSATSDSTWSTSSMYNRW